MTTDSPIGSGSAGILLTLARESIDLAFAGEPARAPDRFEPVFEEQRGAFVTLKKSGRLRGCIGTVEPTTSLWETVTRMARAAAFDDPRFPPLTRDELPAVTLEISVLSTPRRIASPGDIEVGVDGLIVEHGERRGLLLPQVAVEWKWSAVEFFEQTCRKAGVPEDSWRRPDVELYAFSAEVFAEDEG